MMVVWGIGIVHDGERREQVKQKLEKLVADLHVARDKFVHDSFIIIYY